MDRAESAASAVSADGSPGGGTPRGPAGDQSGPGPDRGGTAGLGPSPAAGPTSAGEEALDLTVVVPAYNEARRLAEGVDRFLAAVDRGALVVERTEVLVVDDGSTDGTAALARRLLGALPHVSVLELAENSGKGAAIRAGVAAARSRTLAYMDADMAIDPDQIPLLTAALRTDDLAIGSRTQPGSRAEGATLTRTLMSHLFTAVVNRTTNVSFGDTQCGFKGFRTPVARLLFHLGAINGFAFDVELLSLARRLGFSVAEVPVRWRHVPGSRIHLVGDALVMARDVTRSRSALRSRPPVPALVVPAGPPGAGGRRDCAGPPPSGGPTPLQRAVAAAGPVLAVMADAGGGATILFPMSRPSDLDAVAARLEAAAPGRAPERRALTFAELKGRAPLRFVRPDDGATLPEDHGASASPPGGH